MRAKNRYTASHYLILFLIAGTVLFSRLFSKLNIEISGIPMYVTEAGTTLLGWSISAKILRRGSGTLVIPMCGAETSRVYFVVSAFPLVKALKMVVRPLLANPIMPTSTLISLTPRLPTNRLKSINDLSLLFLWRV